MTFFYLFIRNFGAIFRLFMRFLSLFAMLFVTMQSSFICPGQSNKNPPPHTHKVRPITINDKFDLVPSVIPASSIGVPHTRVSGPFVPAKVLPKLFPGTYRSYHRWGDSGERIVIEAWISKGLPKKAFDDWENVVHFPYPVNVTELRDTLQYTDKTGNRYILMTFATHDGDNCLCMFCGRFVGVIMGAALFKEVGRDWEMVMFNPSVGCYGAFQSLPSLHHIQLGNGDISCYLLNGNGGGGAVYYDALHVFSVIDNQFKEILVAPEVRRYNTPSSRWDMKMNMRKDSTSAFWPLQIELKGTFIRYTPDPAYDTTDSPPELARQIVGKDSFNFTVYRKFEFKNGKYHKTGSSVKIR